MEYYVKLKSKERNKICEDFLKKFFKEEGKSKKKGWKPIILLL